MATVEAWPVPWTPYVRCGGVARPLSPLWPPWGRGKSHWPPVAAVGRGPSIWPGVAAVGAWAVPWARCGCRGHVACPLGPVYPLLRDSSPGPRVAAVGA